MLLVTGANGQLGTELKNRISSNAVFTDVQDLDITNASIVKEFVHDNNIDTIINCAAYTNVDAAEYDIETATKINVLGPKNLAKSDAKIIHISTDYVFDGHGFKPYHPYDNPNPISVYGKTKLAGENAVIQYAPSGIIIRTAWLYSPYGNNFVKTMRRLGAERDSITVVTDQVGTPTYAGDLADAIIKILPQIDWCGTRIYHYTNAGICSWYDFAHKIMELSGLKCVVKPIPSSAYPTRAARPFYSVLSKDGIVRGFNIELRHWEDALRECIAKLNQITK